MFLDSVNPTGQKALLDALLVALGTRPAAALLTTPTLHLYSALTGTITPNATVAQFTECDFAGYAAVTLPTLSGPINLSSGLGYGMTAPGLFTAGAISGPGQNALGYWIDNTSSEVYLAEAFPSPVPFNNIGDFLSLQIVFALAISCLIGT